MKQNKRNQDDERNIIKYSGKNTKPIPLIRPVIKYIPVPCEVSPDNHAPCVHCVKATYCCFMRVFEIKVQLC